jgi:hypothetical protein
MKKELYLGLDVHKDGPVKSETDGKLDACENCRVNKNIPCDCRHKLEDGLITGVRGKEIACGVKSEAKTSPRKQTKGALSSIRRKSRK